MRDDLMDAVSHMPLRRRTVLKAAVGAALAALISAAEYRQVAADTPAFADPTFAAQWMADEVVQPNFWGQPITGPVQEDYAEAPNGLRLVQYFEKGRMELTNGAVTSGALVLDMIHERIQIGDDRYWARGQSTFPRQADEPLNLDLGLPQKLAGDPGIRTPSPTYLSVTPGNAGKPLSDAAPNHVGMLANFTYTVTVNADGTRTGRLTGDETTAGGGFTTLATYDERTQHNVPAVFASFRERAGKVAVGAALTEAFHSPIPINGQPIMLFVQLFERRVLIWNDATNDPATVQFGNCGRHYMDYHYPVGAPAADGVIAPGYAALTTQQILARRPFAARNPGLFPSSIPGGGKPGGGNYAANTTGMSQGQTTDVLADLLRSRFTADPSRVGHFLDLLNAPHTVAIVPDFPLRAALIALAGTWAEPAIDRMLDGTWQGLNGAPAAITFHETPANDYAVTHKAARNKIPTGKYYTYFDPYLRNEDFRRLSCTMAHEAVRVQPGGVRREDVFAFLSDTLLWMQYALYQPAVLGIQTQYVADENLRVVYLLNSAERSGTGFQFLTQNGVGIYPQRSSTKDFYNRFYYDEKPKSDTSLDYLGQSQDADPVADPLLRTFAARITADPRGILPDGTTIQGALDAMNGNITLFTPDQLIQIAQNLQLYIPQGQ